MQRFRLPFLVLALMTLISRAFAQDSLSSAFSCSAHLHYGFLIAHRPMIVPLQRNHMSGFELNVAFPSNNKAPWREHYDYPETGLSFARWNTGNKEQLGAAWSLIPYVDFPLQRYRRSVFSLKFGWGIGYVEKIFDAETNYKNIAIGSHLNCALQLQPHFTFKVANKITAGGGLNITHFSNGSVATPNLGINLLGITLHAAYAPGFIRSGSKRVRTEFTPLKRYTVFVSASVKQTYPADGNYYSAFTLSGNRAKQISEKIAWGYGADVFYDDATAKKVLEQDGEVLQHRYESIRAGLHGSCELIVNRFTLSMSMGGYLYSKVKNDGMLYHRFGLRYQTRSNLFICMNLKSHWAKADFIEWGIGYRFNKKPKA